MAVKEITWRGFQDGINTRDGASELGEHELINANNMTVNERGQLVKRLGYTDRYGEKIGSGDASNVYYWKAQDKVVKQVGTGIHIDGAFSIKDFTTIQRVGFAEFGGKLYIIHPEDKLFSIDSALTVAGPIANSHKGNCLAVWQNALFSAGDPDNKDRLTWSNTGDADTWPASPNSNLIRDKDSEIITALGGADGSDISGRPGLLVFKEASTYRVHTLNGGLYNTIDVSAGSSSNIGVVSAFGRTYAINTRGIFSTDGNGPMREESGRIENLFSENEINQSRGDLYCAGRWHDRLYFSLPRATEARNTLELELHPLQGWIMSNTKPDGVACYAHFGQGVSSMIFGAAHNDSAGHFYNSHRTGADAGVDIQSSVQLRWIEPNEDSLVRIRRVRVIGLGTFTLEIRQDYSDDRLSNVAVDIDHSDAAEYDDVGSVYDSDDVYGILEFQGHVDAYSLGVARSISCYVSEGSSITTEGRTILDGTSPEQGAWTLAAIKMRVIDLGEV